MVSGEGSMQCQLVGCQDRPVLKCPRRGKGWGLAWDVGRKDNWHRTYSQRWLSWVPTFVLSVRVQRGPLTWPRSSLEWVWEWDRDGASCPNVLHGCDNWPGLDQLPPLQYIHLVFKGTGAADTSLCRGKSTIGDRMCRFSSCAALPVMSQEGLGLDQGLANYGPMAKPSPLTIFVQPKH